MNSDLKENPSLVSNIRILLIDDGCGSLSYLHQLLAESDFPGFHLDCVTTLIAAVNRFRHNSYDVCLIDSAEKKAGDFLSQGKKLGCSIPMIVLTSTSGAEVLDAIRAGAADCLFRDQLSAPLLEQSICKVIQEGRLKVVQLENERRYLGLIENARDVIYTQDLKGNYISANKAAEQLTGYSREEILGLNVKQVVAEEYWALTREMVNRKMDQQKETSYELELLTKDGRRVPVEVNSHLIYNAGRAVAVQGIARDITQRRGFEAALKDSEQSYRELFENANDIIYSHDLEGNFTALNRAGELVTGYSCAEALQMNIDKVVVPEDLNTTLGMLAQKAFVDSPRVYELEILTKAGKRVPLELSTRRIFRNGSAVGIQGIARDITERMRSELERRAILEIIQSVTLTSNLDELLSSIHQALRKILYAENCLVALYNKETGQFSRAFFSDELMARATTDELEGGATSYVFRTGQPLLMNPQTFRQLLNEGQIELIGELSPSWLGVPLNTPSETIGVLVVQHYEDDHAYTQRDLDFLDSVGGQIALAIERKRAEKKLQESEAEYRDIFDNATMGIYRSSCNGQLLTANRALARILGYSSVAELLCCNLATDIYCDPEQRNRLISELPPSGSDEGLEVRWKKKDGSAIWVQINAIAVKGESHETLFFDGFVHDITERKKAEQALRETEDRYQRLVELSPDGIIVHSDGHVSFVNSSGLRLIGATDGMSVIGHSIYDFIDDRQHAFFVDRVARLQKGEFLTPVELRARRLDGVEVECEVMSVPFTHQDKPAVQVVIRDITERKQAQQALDEANRRALADYERLVERIAVLGQSLGNARELTAILRAIRDFTSASVPCNGILVTLYESEKSVRRCVYCWIDDVEVDTHGLVDFPVGNGTTGRAIRSGSIVIDNDYQASLVASRNSTIGDCTEGKIPRSALSAPMTIMGRTVGCIEIQSYLLDAYTDEHTTAMRMAASLAANAFENVALIEREQERADQLRQSQKMEAIGQLAGGVAHDFNNLLTAISGYSELGLLRLKDNDPLRRNLEEITKASTRAASLTRQLLAFSRKQMLQAKVVDLNAIVSDLDKMLRRLIGEDIDLVSLLETSPCLVKADPGQVEQVIMNLAVNARDAMPRGGKLTIETGHVYLDEAYAHSHVSVKSGNYAMLAVSDNGIGIDVATQKRVFEPFFTTKEVGKGTGLGLSTVYGIVSQSGGTIWLYSEKGQGSTFKVYLPLVSEPTSLETKVTSPELFQGRETVLLVEDEEMVRDLSREILEMNGYRVLAASNGEEACRMCEMHRGEIALMITDVVMPQMSGRELAERIVIKRPQIQVLYMSGYTDDAIVRHGILDDGMPFLQKPFTPAIFARKVRDLLKNLRVAPAPESEVV